MHIIKTLLQIWYLIGRVGYIGSQLINQEFGLEWKLEMTIKKINQNNVLVFNLKLGAYSE